MKKKPIKVTPQAEAEEVSRQVKAGLLRLHSLAKQNDAIAAFELVGHAKAAVRILQDIENIHCVRWQAAESIAWPGWITVDKDVSRAEQQRVRSLRLGASVTLNYAGRKQWTRATPETKVALQLRDRIEFMRATFDPEAVRLKPFSRATSKEYYKFAVPLLKKQYGERFENHPIFAHYKTHVAVKNRESLSPDTQRRKMILTKLEQSFHTIAPKTPIQ